ncbi:MAG: ribosome maturation factor RimP [Thermoanaerobaculia bacterium]
MGTKIQQDLSDELAALAADLGCELLEADFRGGVLRLVLDHPDGVTLEHCESMSRQASALLDVADFGTGRYTLEVSSPGLDRKLYGTADYERFRGEHVRVTWRSPEAGKRTIVGDLEAFAAVDGGSLQVKGEDGTQHRIPLGELLEARLEPQFQ